MVEAAILSDQQPHQISFKATADTLRQYRKALWQYRDRPRKLQSIVNDLLLIMASKQVGHRPTEWNRERSSDDLNPTKDDPTPIVYEGR